MNATLETHGKKILIGIGALLIFWLVGKILIWDWMITRQYCQIGHSFMVTRKTGDTAPLDSYAKDSQQGVQEQMKGPGRHFVNPFTYTVRRLEDVVVKPGQICVIKNNIGQDLPAGRFIADAGEKGTLRNVLTPGTWRINPHGQSHETVRATTIRPGYVGVQTLRENRKDPVSGKAQKKGILAETLQPGLYYINPREIKIDIVEIGYQVWSQAPEFSWVNVKDKSGKELRIKQFVKGTGVSFPLADGKEMYLDFTVVWGIFPENAPRLITEYGTVEMAESKIIEPQVLSICKNLGSNLTTKEFIEGKTREEFQAKVTTALQEMGKKKGIDILIALVRSFHPAEDIKATIQERMLAEEEQKTLLIEQETDRVAARLEEAEKMVEIAIKDFDGETAALVAQEKEDGAAKAAETMAEADKAVATLNRTEKEVKAEARIIEGQAKADVTEALKKAEAMEKKLLITAFGGPDNYNLSQFAEGLPDDLKIRYLSHGTGTLWTSPNMNLKDLSAKKILENATNKTAPSPAAPRPVNTTPRTP
ncbi:MAG: SPFH domain-containing protein [Phycisphaerae bacterium]|jgi:regulator of protease activity HflC (stomatin/prohibitin superfamily)|nr:SPFH domain-containing protein [Phycisphaerae bacterium]